MYICVSVTVSYQVSHHYLISHITIPCVDSFTRHHLLHCYPHQIKITLCPQELINITCKFSHIYSLFLYIVFLAGTEFEMSTKDTGYSLLRVRFFFLPHITYPYPEDVLIVFYAPHSFIIHFYTSIYPSNLKISNWIEIILHDFNIYEDTSNTLVSLCLLPHHF